MFTRSAVAAITALACAGAATAQRTNVSLPIVDLGYELHQAGSYNATGGTYNFTNIRYAAPPVGELRWTKPQAPAVNRSAVETGSVGRVCPQALPAWAALAEEWLPGYLLTGKVNTSLLTSSASSGSASTSIPAQDPRTSEDCLFLDVVVPKTVFDSAGKGYGAPVLVWIYGGFFTSGSKDGSGNPAGLLARGEESNEDVIFVSLNYRLGAFGWLSGSTLQENGTSNLGLHDQRMALEWIQNNIHLFGGDPTRVTVFGESAGAASIMHQITAYGGRNASAPFAQAVLQSPAFQPIVGQYHQEQILDNFLELLNVSTIEEARQLPYESLQLANIILIANSSYGSPTFGPAVDGDIVPALAATLLLHGQFDKSVRVMVGHNADEGLLFTYPVNSTAQFSELVVSLLPSVAAYPKVLSYIVNTLYPAVFDGTQAQGYTDQISRAAAAVSEVAVSCNTYYLDKAFGNDTYAYLFTVPPALHGQDIPYTFYNGNGSATSSVLSTKVAYALQDYIISFAAKGNPNVEGVPFFPLYQQNATIQELGISGISEARDPTANSRCDWWQKALYY